MLPRVGIHAPSTYTIRWHLLRHQQALCAREAARRLPISRGGNGGSIVFVSSKASQIGSPHEYADYAASKGAVDSLTLGLSKELAQDGVRVNTVRLKYTRQLVIQIELKDLES
ncbi:uncharacterized protein MYCFIDRAFT_212484 [Pseudocercospora fijiensis CIRAD86]|uniref:Ketoreductase (KR) domain-containing protein n=1 Tax=Pseudocercospora fijiensis (strain CIRAD86) TaxID=383855 RepID=M2YM91_PSEFD|nr:uncharacterized protein MYCFIDRAFT_212484 [Pseudocercospora fijiensis CIRAD86]EME78850.1 hypothetical protein MYCFIDRAFT_212484 [Pseudocercospora fijiensis CIRAD86]